MQEQNSVNQLVDHLFRHESGKMVAVLTRLFGFQNYDVAKDIVQETLLSALEKWRFGLPENPTAWLYSVAKNKAIDLLRREKLFQEISSEIIKELQIEEAIQAKIDTLFLENEVEDSQLRMIFACCHDAIPAEAQISLILRTLCGLSIVEIANAFLTNNENINKRLYRAREKIRKEGIELEVPQGKNLTKKLDSVLKTIYLLFNEGYNSSNTDALIRRDLCEEAMRLCYILTKNAATNLPKTNALMSLICFQTSRFDARLDDENNIILLKNQNRKKWDKLLIMNGLAYLDKASKGEELTEYHLEAAIASYHAKVENFEQTNWQAIFYLYQLLAQINHSPIIEFNKVIAQSFVEGAERAIESLKRIEGLENNQFYHTTFGDFYAALNQKKPAKKSYEKALKLTKSKAESKLILEKIEEL